MRENILIVEDEYIVADHLKRFLQKAGHKVCGIAANFEEAMELIQAYNPSWVLLDICLRGVKTGIDLAKELSQLNIPFIYLSANMTQKTLEDVKNTKPYGFMSKPFKDKELMIMLDIAMDRHQKILEAKQINEEKTIQNIRNTRPEPEEDFESRIIHFADALQSHVDFELMVLSANKASRFIREDVYILRTEPNEYTVLTPADLCKKFEISNHEYINLRKVFSVETEPAFNLDMAFRRKRMDWPLFKYLSNGYELEADLFFPFGNKEQLPGLTLFSREPNGFNEDDIYTLSDLKDTLKETLKIVFTNPEPVDNQSPVKQVKKISEQQSSFGKALSGIIGRSSALLSVLEQLKIVAPTATSVLIMGESGTGKERIAQAVHELSPRAAKPFIIVNCAALPVNLIESELFGHEKGAFTGAGEKRIGKFEQADGGTIFLDEIGELPMESQVKLLRVLQEKEIERVGGNQRIKVDVRIIAATNRNMEKEVAEGHFRLDLYYRLNVFPLELPPLRERRQDIPELVNFFVEKYAASIGEQNINVSPVTMNQLVGYPWPGNIRELSHVLERAVLLSRDGVINNVSLPRAKGVDGAEGNDQHYIKSFEENERDHILYVLRKCFGRVAGEGGAAEMLRVPPTTLTSKIKRLGILRKHISPEE